METSNVIGGSNVYPCNGSPLSDQEFVNHIEDYNHIRAIRKQQEFRQSSVSLTKKQAQLMQIEMRCVYAKKDPCWGYINNVGVRSKCVEGNCPQIKKCNPDYTQEDTVYWTMTDEVRLQYGHPDKQKKYYLVDLVSDEEMLKYISDPKGAGMEFPPIKDEFPKQENKTRPEGRRQVIIGYEETYFGDADNQLSPIWGYVDDADDNASLVTSRYGSTTSHVQSNVKSQSTKKQKKSTARSEIKPVVEPVKEKKVENKPVVEELSQERKNSLETSVRSKVKNTFSLTEVSSEIIKSIAGDTVLNIVLSNEAEMTYVSSMLLQAGIVHDLEQQNVKTAVCLWQAESKCLPNSLGVVLASSTFLKQGCNKVSENLWEALGKISEINEIEVSGRDFFSFEGKNGIARWGCRNLYGATHLAVRTEDFELTEEFSGEQKITLMKDSKNYIVLSSSTAEQLGVTTDKLWQALEALKKTDEISEFPRVISGLVLTTTAKGIELKGIGHMKFDEY